MSDDGEKGHFGDAKLDRLHKPIPDTTEDGACLTGHEYNFDNFKKKVTCNYRYQAYEQAKSHGEIKSRLHGYKKSKKSKKLNTSAYETDKEGMYPEWYTAKLDAPDPDNEDWHLGGPKTAKTRKKFSGGIDDVKPGHNFTNARWPYWNNAHHLIPKGTLKSRVLAEPSDVANLIQKALLKAKYNINHKINMLLMPQDREVAAMLNLPRHIQLKDGDDADLKALCTDHPVYNDMVVTMNEGLTTIMRNYRKICDEAIEKGKETHRVPKANLDKKKLERLSRKLLRMILDAAAGKSIDSMAKGQKANATAIKLGKK